MTVPSAERRTVKCGSSLTNPPRSPLLLEGAGGGILSKGSLPLPDWRAGGEGISSRMTVHGAQWEFFTRAES
jgi:hypothetical protein